MKKILFVTSEAHPLIKTGGLADVSGSLPIALQELRQDVRLLLPAYQAAVKAAGKLKAIASLSLPGIAQPAQILEGLLPHSKVKVWLLDCPDLYERAGNPYLAANGKPWPDNDQRFALLARAAVELAQDRAGLNWRPDVVHCNDWQSALTPALLALEGARPATVFTIHNLSYQGLFPHGAFAALDLPSQLWHHHALEFHGQLSFIKGGLVFADMISTVSPTYAKEIQTPAFGYGLEGLLKHRGDALAGILNGVDYTIWNPAKDAFLAKTFSARNLKGKAADKQTLQQELGLPVDAQLPVIGLIGRLVPQKGIDLVLDVLPELIEMPVQLAILGSGEAHYEQALYDFAKRYPQRIGLRLGYDEGLAHRIEAGSDCFLMPSRFEPCGLNQMYSLRYGTVPIVHRVGGLADTVVDVTPKTLAEQSATGFCFDGPTAGALMEAIKRAITFYSDARGWKQLMLNGMRQDFSWQTSARRYLELYDEAARRCAAAAI